MVRDGEKLLVLCSKVPRSIFNNCSDIVTYNEKYIHLMFISVSGPELLKLLEFPKCQEEQRRMEYLFVVHNKFLSTTPELSLMRECWKVPITSGWGLVARGTSHMIRKVA